MVLLEWPSSFPCFPLSVQITMNEAGLEANPPTEGPALPENRGDLLERKVETSDVVSDLETMQITGTVP